MKSYLMSSQSAEATSTPAFQPRPEPLGFRLERERPKPNLTEREKEVLRLVQCGDRDQASRLSRDRKVGAQANLPQDRRWEPYPGGRLAREESLALTSD